MESIVRELRLFAKKKPLRGNDLERARLLTRELKRSGYGYAEIRNLTDGGFSEATLKLYAKNVPVDRPEVKEENSATLKQLVDMGLTLSDVESTVSFQRELQSNELTMDDAISLLTEVRTSKKNVKEAIETLRLCRESHLSLKKIDEALGYKGELEASGFSIDHLKELVSVVGSYGGYHSVMEGMNKYAGLKGLEESVRRESLEEKQLKDSIADLQSEVKTLEDRKASAKGLIDLYQALKEKGYDLKTLGKIGVLSNRYGGISKFLEGVDKYATIIDLNSQEQRLDNAISDKKSAHTALAAKYAHLKTITLMCDKLLRKGFTTEAIASVYSSSKKYGEPIKMLRAIEAYGDLQKIIKESDRLALEKQELEARTREAEKNLNVIRAQYDELKTKSKESLDGLVTGLSDTTKAIEKKALDAMESISQKYETYSERLGQLKAEGGHFEEELNLARVVLAIKKYPSEIKDLPLDYALQLLEAVERLCRVKGLDPKVKAPDWVRKEYYFLPSEIQFSHLIAMVKEELINQIGGVKK